MSGSVGSSGVPTSGQGAGLVERSVNIAVGVAAIVLAIVVVRREFWPPTDGPSRARTAAVEVADWRTLRNYGVLLGDPDAPVVLTEFGDYQCPFCKMFHERLHHVQDSLSERVAFLYIHYPLPSHRMAVPAANAAMCAHEQGRFEEMHDVLFEKQDSLGVLPWEALARTANVDDIERFLRCQASDLPHQLVAAGKALADSLGVDYTPTIMINQWRYEQPPVDSLRVLLQAAINRARR